MADPNRPSQQIQVDIDADRAEGIYSNLAFLHLSPSEFILDFARLMPGTKRAKVQSRIILTPQGAKGLLGLLQANVKNYEEKHGEIHDARASGTQPIGFQSGAEPGEGSEPD